MNKRLFGTFEGQEIYVLTLSNENAEVKFINFGASIMSFKVFGVDVAGGFDSLSDYVTDRAAQGAVVGRVANRIENAMLNIDGAIYMLPTDSMGNCLHGGRGFHRRVWEIIDLNEQSVTMGYYSADGEEGFPAGLYTKIKYTLHGTALFLEYEAIPEGKTAVALTNHVFFNLDGWGGDVMEHTVQIYAHSISEINKRRIPTGKHPAVEGTAYDFTEPRAIGLYGMGYDHNYVLCPRVYREFLGHRLGLCAEASGKLIKMKFYTDQPCAQFYTGNYLGDGPNFRGGVKQIPYGGLCFEAQTEPNCVNHGVGIYDAGEAYRQFTVYEFEKIK